MLSSRSKKKALWRTTQLVIRVKIENVVPIIHTMYMMIQYITWREPVACWLTVTVMAPQALALSFAVAVTLQLPGHYAHTTPQCAMLQIGASNQ